MNIDLPHFATGMKIQNFQYNLKMAHVIFLFIVIYHMHTFNWMPIALIIAHGSITMCHMFTPHVVINKYIFINTINYSSFSMCLDLMG